ncbi:MAG: phosphatase PAP2 family protein [Chitinophagaceae bacterium]|nr:phosphatase PAP2 family protein [Chitinophagaceae bacterium]
MTGFVNRIKQQRSFFFGYLIILITGCILLFAKGKAGSFLLLNNYHFKTSDYLFIGYTNFGDGIFSVLISLFYFFVLKKRKLGLILLIAYSFTGILAQVIKPIIESPRPVTYFYPKHFSFFIDDIINKGNNSFPSGHTVSAFALATVLALYAVNKWQQLLLLALAVMVGFSRIYLSQHFLTDVLAGSLLGIVGAVLCVYWCRNLTDDQLLYKKKEHQTGTIQ